MESVEPTRSSQVGAFDQGWRHAEPQSALAIVRRILTLERIGTSSSRVVADNDYVTSATGALGIFATDA